MSEDPFRAVIREWDDTESTVTVHPVKSHIRIQRPLPELVHEIVKLEYEDGVIHEVPGAYFYDVLVKVLPPEPPPDPVLRNVRIARAGTGMSGGPAQVFGDLGEGEEVIFEYFVDELRFSPSEFEGKTREEALKIRHRRDVFFLQS